MGLLDRLLILVAITVVSWLAVRWLSRDRRSAAGWRPPGLESLVRGKLAILYFTTPGCAPCRTIQRPALERLTLEMGPDLEVIEVDALKRPDLADHWGVLTVPTTFVIDRSGRVRGVNHGARGADGLRQQLRRVDDGPSAEAADSRRPAEPVAERHAPGANAGVQSRRR